MRRAANAKVNVARAIFTASPPSWTLHPARWSVCFQNRGEARWADARGNGRAFALPFRRRAWREQAGGEREPALNVIEIEAVRLALAFYFVDQLLPKLRFGNGLRGGDD